MPSRTATRDGSNNDNEDTATYNWRVMFHDGNDLNFTASEYEITDAGDLLFSSWDADGNPFGSHSIARGMWRYVAVVEESDPS
jgi:hypothetical protein